MRCCQAGKQHESGQRARHLCDRPIPQRGACLKPSPLPRELPACSRSAGYAAVPLDHRSVRRSRLFQGSCSRHPYGWGSARLYCPFAE